MSKKHHKHHAQNTPNQPTHTTLVGADAASETSVVKRDLLQTILVNTAFLAILIALFFWNRSNGAWTNWIGHVIKF